MEKSWPFSINLNMEISFFAYLTLVSQVELTCLWFCLGSRKPRSPSAPVHFPSCSSLISCSKAGAGLEQTLREHIAHGALYKLLVDKSHLRWR
jgi:hypothetical protein